jgi:hypothetical protein
MPAVTFALGSSATTVSDLRSFATFIPLCPTLLKAIAPEQ